MKRKWYNAEINMPLHQGMKAKHSCELFPFVPRRLGVFYYLSSCLAWLSYLRIVSPEFFEQHMKTFNNDSWILRGTLHCVGLKYVIKKKFGQSFSHYVVNVLIATFRPDKICRVPTLYSSNSAGTKTMVHFFLSKFNLEFIGRFCIRPSFFN